MPSDPRDPPGVFLTAPPPLPGRRRRVHLVVLGLIMAFGLAKGLYWSVTYQAWTPVDEAQHVAYVESLARGHGIPTVGRDLVPDDVLASVKSVPTSEYRASALRATNDDPRWASTRQQYEAVHGPTYYALDGAGLVVRPPLG